MNQVRRSLAVLALALIALAAGVLWWASRSDGDAEVEGGARGDDRGDLATPADLAGARPDRIDVAPPIVSSPASDSRAFASAPSESALVTGIIVDPSGGPVAGAHVDAFRPAARGLAILDRDYAASGVAVARLETGKDGRFSFAADAAGKYDLRVTAEHFAPTQVQSCLAGIDLVVRLSPGAVVLGAITRKENGAPVAGAEVRCHQYGALGTFANGASDASGRFRFEGLPAARFHLQVRVPAGDLAGDQVELEIGPGETKTHDFALSAGILVSGIVTDAATTRPIEGARVGEGIGIADAATTDASGRYRLRLFEPHPMEQIVVRKDGYGASEAQVGAVSGDAITFDFALTRCRTCRGRVLATSGDPIGGAYVAAVASDYQTGYQRIDWPATKSADDGRFAITGLRSDIPHALLVHRAGFGVVTFDFPDDESARSDIDVGDIVLPAAGSISGCVVDEIGAPAARIEVTMCGANADRYRLRAPARSGEKLEPRVWFYVDERRDVTDADGRFRFDDLCAASFELSASRGDRRPTASATVALADGERRDGLRLVLPGRLEIRGVVSDTSGAPLHKVVIEIRSEPQNNGISAERTLEDGSFRFDGLVAGDYSLLVRNGDARVNGATKSYVSQRKRHVAAGTTNVSFVLAEPEAITGVVRNLAAARAAAGNAALSIFAIEDEWEVGGCALGDDGAFTVTAPRGRQVVLRVRTDDGRAFGERAGVTAGEKDVQVEAAGR